MSGTVCSLPHAIQVYGETEEKREKEGGQEMWVNRESCVCAEDDAKRTACKEGWHLDGDQALQQ